ncbi:hypothetical protein ACFL5N_00255 [bacterium]
MKIKAFLWIHYIFKRLENIKQLLTKKEVFKFAHYRMLNDGMFVKNNKGYIEINKIPQINRGTDAHFYSQIYYEVSDLLHSLFNTKNNK